MRSVKTLVIGGGAAGMAAAIEAARAGKRTLLLEKMDVLGKKLLATGNGRCNYTNRIQKTDCYRGEDPDEAFEAVMRFGFRETLDWFRDIGILPADRQGYIYPSSFQAKAVQHALEREVKRLQVEIHTGESVLSVTEGEKEHRHGFVVTSEKNTYLAEQLLITTGGKASPVHGSSGDGFLFAQEFGHTLIPPLPALSSVCLDGNFMKMWAGNRLQGQVFLLDEDGTVMAKDRGEIQLVAYGISGIPVFQISRFAAKALQERRRIRFVLDAMPDYTKEQIEEELFRRKKRWSEGTSFSAYDLLEGMLPDKFIKTLLSFQSVSMKDSVDLIQEKQIHGLADSIKQLEIPVREVSGFEKAQVCAGGIPLKEIDLFTFESKKKKGLYFAGEILDVDGICGGYNLQWAWTSGITAGRAMGKCRQTAQKRG